MIISLFVFILLIINYRHNYNSHINRYVISALGYLFSVGFFIYYLEYSDRTSIFFKYLQIIVIIDSAINATLLTIHYFKIDSLCFTERNRIIIAPNQQNRNRYPIRREIYIQEKETEFECLICYDISKKYYSIPCSIDEHIICETCSQHRMINIRKCPWCNIRVDIVFK